tara:strand:+ start:541 stop:1188 length:648 start_codon:yes stop_codon:yes gene_type:complete
MKSNKVIEKIKDVLNLNEEVKLEQTKLENGTIIEADSFEEGKEVFIVSDDENVAMPVGEYILEDSRLLVVEEEGVIADVREVSDEVPSKETEEGEEITEDLKEEDLKDDDEDYAEEADVADWKGMEIRIKNLEDAIANIKSEENLKEELSAIEAGNNLTVELSQEIPVEVQAELNQPSADPIVSNPETKQTLSQFKIGANRKANTMDRVLQNFNK